MRATKTRRLWRAGAALLLMATQASAETPLAGCYERIYDEAHLGAHRRQIVRHVRLKIAPTSVSPSEGGDKPPVADALLQVWAGQRQTSFDSLGVCWPEADGLVCNGSDSAAEMRRCRTNAPGVRDCRIENAHSGRFRISPRSDGAHVVVAETLELPQTGSDVGPFLYLSPGDPENRDFLLKAAPQKTCQ
ncbi:MAG: hypothetical protein U1E20_03525 [Methylocystis sp.]|uniref:hypothetical protein n=1 Tax=Methylocystis sp. TaxID=1911079 RepID=UPI0039200A90